MADIATLGIRIDTSEAKAAVSELDKLASAGARTERAVDKLEAAGKKGGNGVSAVERASRGASKETDEAQRSISRYIEKLESTVKTAGMSAREQKLFSLSLQGASSAQLQAADAAIRMNDAYENGVAIGNRLSATVAAIAAAAGAGLIATIVAIDGLAKKAGDLQDFAEKTGDTAENFGSLALAAGTAGVSLSQIADFSVKLSKNLTGVDDESKAAGAAVKALGLNLENFKNLNPADQVEALGKALSSFPDGKEKVAAIEGLARGSSDLLPFLKEIGAEGGRQILLTEDQIQLADAYADKQAKLSTELSLTAQRMALELLPAVEGYSSLLGEIAKDQRFAATATDVLQGAMGGVTTVLQSAIIVASDIGFVFKGVGREIGAVAAQIGALASLDFAGFTSISDAVKEDGVRARAELDRFQKRISEIGKTSNAQIAAAQSGQGDAPEKRISYSGKVPKAKSSSASAAAPDTSYARLLDDIDKATIGAQEYLQTGERLSTAESFRLDMLKRINDEWTRGKLTLNQVVEAEGRANDAYELQVKALQAADDARIKEEDLKRMDAYQKSLDDQNRAIYESNAALGEQIAEIGLTTEAVNALRLSRMDDNIAQQESIRATAEANGLSYEEIAALETKIKLLKEQRALTSQGQIAQAAADSKKESETASKEFADTMRNDLKGAFSAAFRDSSGDPLKAFGDAIENMMFTRAATALSEAAMEGLGSIIGNLGGSSGSGIGDLIGNLLSFDGGGSTGSGPRSGGIDGKGGFLSILHPQETVLDHTKGQTGTGGGVSVVQNISIDSRSDQATIISAMQEAKRQTLAAIQQSRRAGGVYA